MSIRAAILLTAITAGAAAAQHAGHGPGAAPSPYAGLEQRQVKALSAAQIDDLRAGRGSSFALPAELNGYPGPSHALELAERIGLTDMQRQKATEALAAMKADAVRLGEELIMAEAELDRLFRDQRAATHSVAAATEKAARIQGRLRAAHLDAHLAMKSLLTTAQVEAYDQARGYRAP